MWQRLKLWYVYNLNMWKCRGRFLFQLFHSLLKIFVSVVIYIYAHTIFLPNELYYYDNFYLGIPPEVCYMHKYLFACFRYEKDL